MAKIIETKRWKIRFGTNTPAWALHEWPGMTRRQRRFARRPMGRFGGGWAWKLGIAYSRCDVVVDLIVTSIRVTRKRPAQP